jgi:CDP-diglyceride synthetase
MDSLTTSVIALACVFSAALLGTIFGKRIPGAYQASDSKDVVRLVMGLVVTTVAIALGLLVGSAKSFFDTQNSEMAQLAANYVLLDRMLAQYGPEANDARAALRTVLANQLAAGNQLLGSNKTYSDIKSGTTVGESVVDRIDRLSPKNDDQKFFRQQCLNLEIQLGQIRWLMYAQNRVPFPRFLLVMLVGWLIVLFVSFGIFAPRNPLVLAGFLVSAAAVCGAILLILQMYHPQYGLIRVSDAPLHAAMEQIGR